MVMSASATTEQIATADLEMMVIPCYAHPHFAAPARLSRHHLKSALPIPVERKYQFDGLYVCPTSPPKLCLRFGKGIYTSSAPNKYVCLELAEL
jgi:hypothetical protein